MTPCGNLLRGFEARRGLATLVNLEDRASRVADRCRHIQVVLNELDRTIFVDQEVVETMDLVLTRDIAAVHPKSLGEEIGALTQEGAGVHNGAAATESVLGQIIAELRFALTQHSHRLMRHLDAFFKPRAFQPRTFLN